VHADGALDNDVVVGCPFQMRRLEWPSNFGCHEEG
jgi:hypothetical protein